MDRAKKEERTRNAVGEMAQRKRIHEQKLGRPDPGQEKAERSIKENYVTDRRKQGKEV